MPTSYQQLERDYAARGNEMLRLKAELKEARADRGRGTCKWTLCTTTNKPTYFTHCGEHWDAGSMGKHCQGCGKTVEVKDE